MIELATTTVKLLDTLMDVHMKHMEGRYKRRFHDIQKRLEMESKKPPHLKVDSVVDDLNDQLVMLLNNFRSEIRGSSFSSKDV